MNVSQILEVNTGYFLIPKPLDQSEMVFKFKYVLKRYKIKYSQK